jgi:DNA-binding MarR family transcriptional regulator
MNQLLIEFVNTFDITLKNIQKEVGDGSGLPKLTIHQFQYIDAINTLGEPAITEIAEKLNITKPSVTAGIKKLINLGYVVKTQSTADKRVFHVSLTQAGARLIEAKYKALNEYNRFILNSLSEDELIQFESILTKICKFIQTSIAP